MNNTKLLKAQCNLALSMIDKRAKIAVDNYISALETQLTPRPPCPECGKDFSHYTGCSRGVEIRKPKLDDKAAELLALRAELDAAKARAKTAEENWHKNEARIIKLRMVADSMAEIVEYDAGDAEHNMQDFAKELLVDYEKVKGAAWA